MATGSPPLKILSSSASGATLLEHAMLVHQWLVAVVTKDYSELQLSLLHLRFLVNNYNSINAEECQIVSELFGWKFPHKTNLSIKGI